MKLADFFLNSPFTTQMPKQPAIAQHAQQLVPSCLLLFDGLKRAYAARNEDDTDSEGDSDDDGIDR